MFSAAFVWRELTRRPRQAVVGAVGLGLGIALVITVTAMSTGIRRAQDGVLTRMSGVGTDMQVRIPSRG